MSSITLPILLIMAQPVLAEQTEFPSPSTEEIRVDRGLQVVVFPDRVRLQYDLGLSPLAATALLEKNARDLPDTEDRRALMEAFRDMALPEIQHRCRMTVDGLPLELQAVESRIFPKRYVQLTCIFEAQLPVAGDTVRLQLVDGSFRGCNGSHLIALKTDDGAQLQSSTVPLILVRVSRQSLSNDSAAQREAARRAEAVVHRRSEPVDSSERTRANPPDTEKPVHISIAPEDTRWTKLLWLTGCCVGIFAVIVVCWRRTR